MKKIYMVFLAVALVAMMTTTTVSAAATGAESLSIGGATNGTNGQEVDITVNATNVSGVGSFQLSILYDPSILNASDVSIVDQFGGAITAGEPDNVNGSINISGMSDTGLEGSGDFATIKFKVVGTAPSSTDISIDIKELKNITGEPVESEPIINNGTFTVVDATGPCEGGPDCIPPVTTITNVTEHGVYQDNVTIELNATDDSSGVSETLFMINGGTTETYSAPIFVDIIGDDSIAFWSIDKEGNIEPQNVVNFTIEEGTPVEKCDPANSLTDCTAPETTISGVEDGATYDTEKTVTLTAEDNAGGSGVATTEYMVNGAATTTYTVPFIVSTEGSNIVQARSIDKAGNEEDWKSVSFTINQTVTPPGEGNGTVKGKVYYDKDHDKKLDKKESGIKRVHVRIRGLDDDNKNIKLKTHTNSDGLYSFTDLPDGRYSVHVEHKSGWRHTSKVTVKVTIEDGNTKTVNFGKRHR